MSLDENRLLKLIKKAAVDAVNAADPMSLKIGTVESVVPLSIRLNQKLVVPSKQIILTSAVKNGTGTALERGERVLLLRADGGQTFVVLDRLED